MCFRREESTVRAANGTGHIVTVTNCKIITYMLMFRFECATVDGHVSPYMVICSSVGGL